MANYSRTIPCGICGDLFTATNAKTKYCSAHCRRTARSQASLRHYRRKHGHNTGRNATRTVTCAWCGETSTGQFGHRKKYCDEACRKQAQDAAARAKTPPLQHAHCHKCGAELAGKPQKNRTCLPCKQAGRKQISETQRRERARTLARYGLTFEAFERMLADQGHRCLICGTDTPGGKGNEFVVDHCHATGRVRGLLCHRCNSALGLLEDDPARMLAAIRYLGADIKVQSFAWWAA